MSKKEVLIIGAGNSGRGMLGEMFYQDGWDITFCDNDTALVDGLRSQGSYHVKKTNLSRQTSEIVEVKGFQMIDTVNEEEEYLGRLAHTKLIATALKPAAFDDVIRHLALAVKIRYQEKNSEIACIILGANYVGLLEYYQQGITAYLTREEKAYFDTHIVLVMSIVNRKNLKPICEENWLDPYTIIGDDKPVLRVEDLEAVRALDPFPSFFQPEKNLSAAMAIKIWSGNVVQCSMAFVALKKGMRTSYQAACDEDAARIAYHVALEAYHGVFREYHVEEADVEAHAREAIEVFRNNRFSDDLYRIAREPLRKMSRNDRFVGPALLCLKYGKMPYFIAKALAYGFVIRIDSDPDWEKIASLVAEKGIRGAVCEICQLDDAEARDHTLIELIVDAYADITKESFAA